MNSSLVEQADVVRVSKAALASAQGAAATSSGKRAYCPRCKRTHFYPADVSAELAERLELADPKCPRPKWNDQRKLQWLGN